MLEVAAPPLSVFSAFGFASAVVTESSLSFLGMGGGAGRPTWGALAAQGRAYAGEGLWHLALFPGLLVFLCVVSLNRVGEALGERD